MIAKRMARQSETAEVVEVAAPLIARVGQCKDKAGLFAS